MTIIRASVDALCRDGAGLISRERVQICKFVKGTQGKSTSPLKPLLYRELHGGMVCEHESTTCALEHTCS